MKTILQLVHQYKGDVEQRIKCLEFERDNNEVPYIPEIAEDYNAQIAHWEATLKQIDKVLAKYEEAISITVLAMTYEWVCPECSTYNKSSRLNEEVVCRDCHKSFKINFVQNPKDTP